MIILKLTSHKDIGAKSATGNTTGNTTGNIDWGRSWNLENNTPRKTKKACWCYLIARRKLHLDTTVMCAAAREEGIEMCNTPTTEALKIVKKLREDLKEHYRDHKTKRDKYLLSKANLESDAEKKGNQRYQKGRTSESMLSEFSVPSRNEYISARNESNTNTNVMENYGGI